MKKTLALILALLMMLSVALVACGDKEKETEGTTEDPWNYGGDEPENTGNEGNEGENNNTNQTPTNTYEDINATMYVLHPVKVRGIDKKNTQNIVGTLNFKDSVKVTGQNSTWYRVELANGTVGYVYDDILTPSENAVKVIPLETPIEVEIYNLGKHADGTPISLRVRETPWNCSNSDVENYKDVNVLDNIKNGKYFVTDGFKVTKLGATADGEWIYIKYIAEVDGAAVTEWGFCYKDHVKTEGESAPVDPNTPPTIQPIL